MSIDEVKLEKSTLLQGLINFLFSTLVYSLFIWFVSRTLEQGNVVSWKLQWTQCTALVASFNFVRIWDRTFMR